jgi:F0F1-type ATP synthase delta subunit
MKTSRTKIASAVADKTLKAGASKRLSREVAAYLLSERRVNELDSVLRDVSADWAAAGYVEAVASSARPLSAAVQADIKRRVKQLYPSAKRIIVTTRLDPAVLGGVRLNLPDQQLDLSVEAKLNKFKRLTNAGKD